MDTRFHGEYTSLDRFQFIRLPLQNYSTPPPGALPKMGVAQGRMPAGERKISYSGPWSCKLRPPETHDHCINLRSHSFV